ncbi:MAG TPA: phospholipase D family protein [Pedococcus sp.]|jgi:phosphatidylserine/phosphatidylglycerophosphate/cardiolipin synthase-like enzyme|nr:phospholipase D family protein [Pedococcus sp.]
MDLGDWFLSAAERGNPDTILDRRHTDSTPWTEGNHVRPLVHGATYFAELYARLEQLGPGDLVMFVDWRGDPDELLVAGEPTAVGDVLARAARRGADVRGLIWRSHWDRLSFSSTENRHIGEEINAAGGQCVLDMRVRVGGSHHQKFVVLRHRDRPDQDIAFLGGIDLCHSRRDDQTHAGDPQKQPMAAAYGSRPPWHDIQLAITGPAVGDVETVFRERWDDPQPAGRSPLRWLGDRLHNDHVDSTPLPVQTPDPAPTGDHPVQLLRTYPRRLGGYPFASRGERSVARGYAKAVRRARRLIYVEDQYFWSPLVARIFADALRREPGLRLVAVLPQVPDQDGRFSMPPNLVGRNDLMARLRAAAPGRVAFYGIENAVGTPVYVHAKTCVVDDEWATVGSDNFNRRSWTHDSEVSAAVCHPGFARELRSTLAREHLGLAEDATVDLDDQFDAYAAAAAALGAWHDGGRQGPRPPGQLRPIAAPPLSATTRLWAGALYRWVYDPDGRPVSLKLRGRV